MKRRMKISLIIASVFCLVGVLLFGIAFAMAGFDIKLLSNEKYELNVHDVELTFDGIEIESSVSDITFTLSKDNTCRVMCHEREKVSHEVLVENGKLTVPVHSFTVAGNFFDLLKSIAGVANNVEMGIPAVSCKASPDLLVKGLSVAGE